jgi:hypothetical protein
LCCRGPGCAGRAAVGGQLDDVDRQRWPVGCPQPQPDRGLQRLRGHFAALDEDPVPAAGILEPPGAVVHRFDVQMRPRHHRIVEHDVAGLAPADRDHRSALPAEFLTADANRVAFGVPRGGPSTVRHVWDDTACPVNLRNYADRAAVSPPTALSLVVRARYRSACTSENSRFVPGRAFFSIDGGAVPPGARTAEAAAGLKRPALSRGESKVVTPSAGDQNDVRNVLHTIVSDPVYGASALSSSQTMANLLKDLMPDSPREASLLVAAAEAGVASTLQDHVSQGMDVRTASALVASSFAARTAFKPEACNWAVAEIAVALGLDPAGQIPVQGVPPQVGGAQSAPTPTGPGAGYQQQPGYQQPGRHRQPDYQQGGQQQPGAYQQRGYEQAGYQGPGYQQPGSPQQASPQQGSPQPGYQRPGYQQPGVPPLPAQAPYWQQQPQYQRFTTTNGLAIASLVLGILWLFWLGSVASLVFGLIALKQIKDNNEKGRGLAMAGIILSVLALAGLIILIIIGAEAPKSSSS